MSASSHKGILSLGIGLLVSAAAMYLAFRHVPFAELWKYLGQINYWWMIPSALLVVVSFAVRTWRWQIILQNSGRVGYWQAFHPLMIGFMLNCIMPGRVGEVARPLLLQQRERYPFSTGLATVVVERVFDFTFLVCCFGLILLTVDIDPKLQLTFGSYQLSRDTLIFLGRNLLTGALVLLTGIGLVCWRPAREWFKQVIHFLPVLMIGGSVNFKARIKRRISDPLATFTDNFARGFEMVKKPRQILACTVLSVLIWSLGAFSYYTMMLGAPGLELSYLEIAVVMIIVSFFIALPSVPGFWGIWEAGGVFALMLFGISTQEAAGYTLVNHVVQIFPVIIMGFFSALCTGVNVMRVARREGG